MNNCFGKVSLPFVTPFGKNEEIDYGAFTELLEYAAARNYLDSAVITGTTGEFNTLTVEERAELCKTAVRVLHGRYPVIAGTGAASTRETVRLTRMAEEAGADAVLAVAPFYCKPTQEAIIRHYERLLCETSAKVIVYNIPIFTGVNISPKTLARIASLSGKVIGIKDESGVNPVQLTEYMNAVSSVNPDFAYYNGDDVMLMPALSQGIDGTVSGLAQIMGSEIRDMFKLYNNGNPEMAHKSWLRIFAVCSCFTATGRIHPNPILRAAIELVTGIGVGAPRMPLDPITAEERKSLAECLKQLGMI